MVRSIYSLTKIVLRTMSSEIMFFINGFEGRRFHGLKLSKSIACILQIREMYTAELHTCSRIVHRYFGCSEIK